MKGGHMTSGFTIIETMIVLAVTGFLLMTAIIALQGKTNETEFEQVINNLQSQLQRTVSDVMNGYSPIFSANTESINSSYDFSCTPAAGSGASNGYLTFTSGSSTQGANEGCTFLGYALQFGPNGLSGGENFYTQFTVAGMQLCAGDVLTVGSSCFNPTFLPVFLQEEAPTVLYPARNDRRTAALPTDLAQQQSIQYGVHPVSMYYDGNPRNVTGVAVMLLTPASTTQQVSLYAVRGTSLNMSNADMASAINGSLQNNPIPVDNIEVCLASGTTNQSGLITIGGTSGQQATVTLKVYSDVSC